MKMYIPELGDKIKLNKDWIFDLYQEYRNQSLFKHFGISYDNSYQNHGKLIQQVTILKDEVLKVDRVYIRKGSEEYSSISFLWNKKRFWAKLHDVNNIEFTQHKTPSITKTIVNVACPHHIGEYHSNHPHWKPPTDFIYIIDGTKYIESDFFIYKITSTKTYGNVFIGKTTVQYYTLYFGVNQIDEVSDAKLKNWICNKHNLIKKDCLWRKL